MTERLKEMRLPARREQVAGDGLAEVPLHIADREARKEILEVRDELGDAAGLARRRIGRSDRLRKRLTKPAIQIGASGGPSMMIWNGRSWDRESAPLLRASTWAIRSCGRSWVSW